MIEAVPADLVGCTEQEAREYPRFLAAAGLRHRTGSKDHAVRKQDTQKMANVCRRQTRMRAIIRGEAHDLNEARTGVPEAPSEVMSVSSSECCSICVPTCVLMSVFVVESVHSHSKKLGGLQTLGT